MSSLHEMGESRPLKREYVVGRNPVLALLKGTREVDTLFVTNEGGGLGQHVALAKGRGIPVKIVTSQKLAQWSEGAAHQGVAAALSSHTYATLGDIFEKAGASPVFLVIADGIEDPHNLGAIVRTAEAAGAHGVVIPKRRSASLSPAAAKAAAGALESLPVVRVTNLAATIDELKSRGVWVYAADMDGATYCSAPLLGPLALVVGSEGSGVGRLIKQKCDGVLSLPLYGSVNSLNASVAAGVLLYEIARQRHGLPTVQPKGPAPSAP